jgi:hypothetical protein
MGRYLQLAILTAGLWACAGAVQADNPAASAESAPAAATATHALTATTTETAATAAASAMTSTPAAATLTTTSEPSASKAPTNTSAVSPVQAGSGLSMPTRGMSMENVEHIFGAPQEKLPAVPDPGTKLHPPITRWVYPDYIVYFEYNYVVHTVLKKHPFADNR